MFLRFGPYHEEGGAAGTAVAEPPSTPAVSDESIDDAALAEVFGESGGGETPDPEPAPAKPAAKAAEPPKPKTPESSAPTTPTSETPKDSEESEIDLTALDDEPEAATPPSVPAPDPFTERLKQYIPNEQILGELVTSYQQLTKLQNALAQGQWAGVEEALGKHAPLLTEAFYQANKEKIVDRYLEEQQRQTDPRYDALDKELKDIKQSIQSEADRKKTADQQADVQRRQQFVKDSVVDLLDKAKFTKDMRDRTFVMKAVFVDLASDVQAFQKAMSGDKATIRKTLKQVLTDFVARDKDKYMKSQTARTKVETQPTPIPRTAAAAGSGDVDVWDEASKFIAEKQRR